MLKVLFFSCAVMIIYNENTENYTDRQVCHVGQYIDYSRSTVIIKWIFLILIIFMPQFLYWSLMLLHQYICSTNKSQFDLILMADCLDILFKFFNVKFLFSIGERVPFQSQHYVHPLQNVIFDEESLMTLLAAHIFYTEQR